MISEVFSSIMGEGKFIGRRYIFVRFKGCPLNCIYCDEYTKDNMPCRVEEVSGSGIFKEYTNIAENNNLIEIINKIKTPDLFAVSFTGGEPLLYADKIKEYTNILNDLGYKTHLESNGMFPNKINYFDYSSIDMKLAEHFDGFNMEKYNELYRNELKSIKKLYNLGSDVYGKVVIMENTKPETVEEVAKDLSDIGDDIILCIQPVSPFKDIKSPSQQNLLKIMGVCGNHLGDNVICTSQIHKYLGML